MDKLSYKDLFDFNDGSEIEKAARAINLLEAEYLQLAKAVGGESERIRASILSVTQALKQNEAILKKLNITSAEQQKNALNLAADVDKQVKAYTELEKAQKGVQAAQKLYDDSVDGLKAKLKALTTEFNSVSKAQQPDRWRQLATSITETRVEAERMKLAARGMAHNIDVATGSYRALQLQTNELANELRNMEGGMGSTSARAKELKDQIYANTQRLKEFDKEINQSWRNVGNYAASIIAAKEELDRNRSSLLAQIAALKQQAAANTQNVDLQNKIQEELKQTNVQLYSVNQQLGSFKSSSDIASDTANKFADRIKRMGIETLGAYVGFQALKMGISAVITMNSELSDAQADVMKTTQMSKEEVNDLTDSFKNIDTRTALKELLAISTVGGQLGVVSSDIEGFTTAIDKAAVALGDEFSGGAEEVATALAKINNVYGISKDVGLEQGLTNIGSAINEVSAKGAATSPFLTDFALRVGAVSSSMGLGLDKVFGYGAALEELGFTSEVAAGSLQRVLGGMAAGSEAFFEVAKMGDATLTLKEFEQLINTDVNKAFNVFLKGLNAGGDSTVAFSKIVKELKLDGVGATSVLTSLAKSTELVATRQETANGQMKEGTSILAEFNVKNDNLAGSLDKLKNGFQALFVSGEIQGALKAMVDSLLWIGAALKTVYNGVKNNKDVIAASVPILIGYRTATFTATVAQGGFFASLGITRIAMLRNIVTMRAWYATMMANPIGLILAGIAALVIGFNRLERSSARNIEMQEKSAALNKKVEEALKGVSQAQREINAQIDNYANLSPAEQTALKERIIKEKQLTIAILERLEAERKSLISKALEIDTFDKIKAGILSMGQAHLYIANIVSQQSARMKEASQTNVDEIARLKESLKGFDIELEKVGASAEIVAAKQADDAAKLLKAEAELQKFRLEQQAKSFDHFVELQEKENQRLTKHFEDGALSAEEYGRRVAGTAAQIENAQREAAILRIRVAAVERDMLLANENLLGAERTKIIEEYAAKTREIQRKLAEDLKIEELMPANAVGKFLKTREEENEKAMKAQGERMKKHLKEWQEAWAISEEKRTAKMKEEQEKRAAIRKAGEELAWSALDASWQLQQYHAENQMNFLQAQQERELGLTGDNAEARKKVEEEYQKKIAELRLKQAKTERLQALFDIGINTAVAVSKAVRDSPSTFGLPFSAFALAQGAIQTALVLAKPLPQYFRGRKNGPAELAIVDEKGPELIESKGKYYLGQDKGPRVAYLGQGDKVYPASETERMLADIVGADDSHKFLSSMQNANNHFHDVLKPADSEEMNRRLISKMGSYFKGLESVIKNKKEVKFNVTKDGIEMMVKTGEGWTKFANERYNNI